MVRSETLIVSVGATLTQTGALINVERCVNVALGYPEQRTLRVAERTLDTLSVETQQQSECVINLTVGSFM